MVTLGLAGVVLLVFLAGVAREPRAFGNAVLLGLALALGALGLAERLADTPGENLLFSKASWTRFSPVPGARS